MIKKIGVAGAGTMGSGIALVAAQSGFSTLLFDVQHGMLEKAKKSIQHNIQHLVDKRKIPASEAS